ncbi:MAG: DUF2064 domain-containing protein [Gemmatimonadales bacterium]|nr:MAG: DUF2064 domain-containing protein [Gemmatimonadales bacterium]
MDPERRDAVRAPSASTASGDRGGLGVVIPTLNEAGSLPGLLGDLERIEPPPRVVVADGGSDDGTPEIAREAGAEVVRAPRGRAAQMNVGAVALSTPWLLFLHADSRLPQQTRAALQAWLYSPPQHEAAHFAFRLDERGPWWTFIETGQRLREALTGMAYGDQGLLVSRRRWEAVGGFPPLPIMEDVEMVLRLKRSGGLDRIGAPVVTSGRRYRRSGVLRGWLRNTALIGLYRLGVPPRRLAPLYPPHHVPRESTVPSMTRDAPGKSPAGSSLPSALVLVFAKAPRPGQVKTRLAADMGDEAAASLYRTMGRQVADGLRGGPYRTRICFAPPDARDEMVDWLGDHGLEFQPQADGDLGRRMEVAAATAFREAEKVCLVGTDTPAVDRAVVEDAFRQLDQADVVVGPARDGGYYLLAMNRLEPTLFRDVPWSTAQVLETTLARARSAGLTVQTLPMRVDVDRITDVPPSLLGTAS